jgi:HD-GYP domain-containing protein (c-di-GMP phosphodiesterase class II)
MLLQAVQAVGRAIIGPDPHMAGHARRVAEYCERVARSMVLSDHDRFLLDLAATFHDVGTLFTPAYILKKPSALAEDEMEEVRVHPLKGAQVFAGEPALDEVRLAIRHHHERVDGTGYPDGLRGDEIPIFSRIILVADTYEAMTHDRAYRRAMSPAEALRRIKDGGGIQFDPEIVGHLVAIVEAEL